MFNFRWQWLLHFKYDLSPELHCYSVFYRSLFLHFSPFSRFWDHFLAGQKNSKYPWIVNKVWKNHNLTQFVDTKELGGQKQKGFGRKLANPQVVYCVNHYKTTCLKNWTKTFGYWVTPPSCVKCVLVLSVRRSMMGVGWKTDLKLEWPLPLGLNAYFFYLWGARW